LNHLDPDSGTSTELFEKLESEGFFILASSNELAIEEILPVYYTRQQVEQTFDIGKNYTGLLPVVRGYIKAPILGVKLINTWLFQLNALGAFSLTNLVFSSIT
ncbi:hypothetical protein, partial [Ileibacterium valens]